MAFEAAPPHHRATHYLVHMSPAAKLKHRPVFDLLERFADGYISSSKCRPVCKLSIIKNSSEMRDNVDVHSISRFRWVCTSCERHSALEVLASLTHQPTNSPAVSTAVVGCHDFIESLGRALPKSGTGLIASFVSLGQNRRLLSLSPTHPTWTNPCLLVCLLACLLACASVQIYVNYEGQIFGSGEVLRK